MKNIYKKIVIIVIILTLSCSITSVGAERLPDIANDSYSSSGIYVSSSSWITIASATNGFNCSVRIISLCPHLGSYLSIRMLGRNGNIVWSETQSLGAQARRDYQCGNDVYKIQAKYTYSAGTVTCYPVS